MTEIVSQPNILLVFKGLLIYIELHNRLKIDYSVILPNVVEHSRRSHEYERIARRPATICISSRQI